MSTLTEAAATRHTEAELRRVAEAVRDAFLDAIEVGSQWCGCQTNAEAVDLDAIVRGGK